MKLSSIIPALTGCVISLQSARKADAFGVAPSAATSFHHTQKSVPGISQLYSSDSDEGKEENDFASEFSATGIYGRLGIKQDEIALGIDANEVIRVLLNSMLYPPISIRSRLLEPIKSFSSEIYFIYPFLSIPSPKGFPMAWNS